MELPLSLEASSDFTLSSSISSKSHFHFIIFILLHVLFITITYEMIYRWILSPKAAQLFLSAVSLGVYLTLAALTILTSKDPTKSIPAATLVFIKLNYLNLLIVISSFLFIYLSIYLSCLLVIRPAFKTDFSTWPLPQLYWTCSLSSFTPEGTHSLYYYLFLNF